MLIRIREPQLEKYDQDGVKQFYLETAELGSENLKILMKDILAYIQSICDVKLYIDFNKNATIKNTGFISENRENECYEKWYAMYYNHLS